MGTACGLTWGIRWNLGARQEEVKLTWRASLRGAGCPASQLKSPVADGAGLKLPAHPRDVYHVSGAGISHGGGTGPEGPTWVSEAAHLGQGDAQGAGWGWGCCSPRREAGARTAVPTAG